MTWLEHHGHCHGFAQDSDDYSFLEMIGRAGSRFEESWVRRFAPVAVQVLAEDWEVRDGASFAKTLRALAQGHDVLTKCALWGDDAVKVFGTADIVAKRSWLLRRFPHLTEGPEPEDPNADDHYVILDCKKISKLESKPTDLRIASAQVRLYSYLLGRIQGVMPKQAYLITPDREDPLPVDVGMTHGGPLDPELVALCDLYRHIKLGGAKYRPWQDAVVAHNHSNHKTEPWTGAVKRITDLIPGGPLERLPGVGRQQAEALSHFGFECLADVLHPDAAGFPFHAVRGIGGRKADILSAVVDANCTGRPSPVPAAAVPKRRAVEIYVDYETLSSICGSSGRDMDAVAPAIFPPKDGQDTDGEGGEIVFMIGCGWSVNGKWHYRQFTAAAHSEAGERHLFAEFLEWLEARGALAAGADAALYHWSPAEVTFSRRAAERLGLPCLEDLPWVDLLKVFKAVPIGVPGSFGFGLKEIGRAVGELDSRYAVGWPEGLNGLAALVAGARMYERDEPLQSPELEILTRYLRTDVRALYEVLRFLRDHGANDRPAANGCPNHECPNVVDVATVGPAADSHNSRRLQRSGRGWYTLAMGRGG